MRNIINEINEFIESIEDLWDDGPLDGDSTETIASIIQLRLDKINGNITNVEFKAMEDELESNNINQIEEVTNEV